MKKIAFINILLLLTACNTSEQYHQMCSSWIGAPETALIRGWGTPIRTYTIDDIKYLTFGDSRIVSLPGTSPSYHTTFFGNTASTTAYGGSSPSIMQLSCETTFTIQYNVVVDYRFEGNNCIAPTPPDHITQEVVSVVW